MGGIEHGGSERAVRAAGPEDKRNPAALFSVEKTCGSQKDPENDGG